MSRYEQQRSTKTPPHVSLRGLRRASGLTLEQAAAGVTEVLGKKTAMTRGAMSAIESGIRGVSQEVLDALAVVYGLDPGDLTTDYQPRNRGAV